MRSIWKGNIGFGLVSVPGKLYKAMETQELGLHLLHTCGARPKQVYHCESCNTYSQRGELTKGYEVGDGHIAITEQDLASLPLKSIHSIDIVGFVPSGAVELRLYQDCYYLGADKVDKPYALLYQIMERLQVIAIAKLVMREREHLCCLTPYDGIFLLNTLVYADEIRDYSELKVKATVGEKELGLAEGLVKQMMIAWQHGEYHNEYREAMTSLIESKLTGEPVAAVAAAETRTDDVISQLLASLQPVGVK